MVLKGGVRGADGVELTLPYHWLMHNDLTRFDLTEFGLDDANEAVAHAAASAGPLRLTVLRPDQIGAGG